MNTDVYRYFYLANRALVQAVSALAELRKQPGLPRRRLLHTQAMIEETRAWMNSDLAECIEQHETDRASRLDHERWKREKKEEKKSATNRPASAGHPAKKAVR